MLTSVVNTRKNQDFLCLVFIKFFIFFFSFLVAMLVVDVVRVSCLVFVNVVMYFFLLRPTFTSGVNKLKIKTFCVLFLLKFTLVFFSCLT